MEKRTRRYFRCKPISFASEALAQQERQKGQHIYHCVKCGQWHIKTETDARKKV